MMNYAALNNAPRLLITVPLHPVQGDRFQPTGFADIGAAEYSRPDKEDGRKGIPMLLVESAQSVANRLEKTCIDGDGPDIDPDLRGLPYVAAILDSGGKVKTLRTSSLVEAHRLASPYLIKNSVKNSFGERLAAEMEYTQKGPLDWKKIYSVLFKYDPNALIHGVFLSLLYDGRVRVPRAVTGFIEAANVKQVVSGGVKNSQIDPKGGIQVEGVSEKGVFSNVPYSRVEYVGELAAYFNLDLSLIRGYGLPISAQHLLIALSLLKIRRFLDSHLRLRTACDLEILGSVRVDKPIEFELPAGSELLSEVKRLIVECKPCFAEPAITELDVKVKVAATRED